MFISKTFIYRVKFFFAQIDYDEKKYVSFESMLECLEKTILSIENIVLVNMLFLEFSMFSRKTEKINKMLYQTKTREIYDDIWISPDMLFDRFDTDENLIVTNVFSQKRSVFTVYDPFVEEEPKFDIDSRDGRIYVFNDSNIYGQLSKHGIVIFDEDTKLVDLRYKNGFNFYNHIKDTPYFFEYENEFLEIFNLDLNKEESFATIASDILSEKIIDRISSIIWLESLDNDDYYEIAILVSIGMNLLTTKHCKYIRNRNYFLKHQSI